VSGFSAPTGEHPPGFRVGVLARGGGVLHVGHGGLRGRRDVGGVVLVVEHVSLGDLAVGVLGGLVGAVRGNHSSAVTWSSGS
jgi:hypothetical protein